MNGHSIRLAIAGLLVVALAAACDDDAIPNAGDAGTVGDAGTDANGAEALDAGTDADADAGESFSVIEARCRASLAEPCPDACRVVNASPDRDAGACTTEVFVACVPKDGAFDLGVYCLVRKSDGVIITLLSGAGKDSPLFRMCTEEERTTGKNPAVCAR